MSLHLKTDQSTSSGKVTLGLVSSLISSQGTQIADATYVLETSDGANIVITERAVIPYVEVLFETGSKKYGWLNNVTAWATGTEYNGLLALNFWQVCFDITLRQCVEFNVKKVGGVVNRPCRQVWCDILHRSTASERALRVDYRRFHKTLEYLSLEARGTII